MDSPEKEDVSFSSLKLALRYIFIFVLVVF
jgi:hypothetical protein